MTSFLTRFAHGLTRAQLTCVVALSFASIVVAVLAVYACRWWNARIVL